MVLSFTDARAEVLNRISAARGSMEQSPLESAAGRVLAADISADRDYPPFPRATRDGYAVRAADGARTLDVIGEVRAGSEFAGVVGAGQCVSIMTGAPVPAGADAVVMVEYTSLAGGAASVGGVAPDQAAPRDTAAMSGARVAIQRAAAAGENIVPRGSESAAGTRVLAAGTRIGFPEVAMLASVGRADVAVYKRPRIAIIPTGDEIVELDHTPSACQIRNSNSYSLRTQVLRAGGEAVPLPIAPDENAQLRELIERGLTVDLLLLSGGVSMGKFDLVEQVLADLGAEIFFTGVEMQPGRPLVFGRARNTWFFGLPGNPLSTMVCFELFARAAIARLSGIADIPMLVTHARLLEDLRVKQGLTRFLPASLSTEGVRLTAWQGSGDVAALVRSNCFLVVPPDKAEMKAGDWAGIMEIPR